MVPSTLKATLAKKTFLLLVLIVTLKPVFGQTYYFDNYGVAEGLYQSKVYDILQDKEHYIWVATLGGVSKFNGKEFINFTSQNGLAQNGVRVIYKDSKGTIWFGHLGGGISRLKGRKLETFLQSGAFFKNDITGIAEDKNHRLWITTYGSGAYCISNPSAQSKNMQYQQFKGNQLSDRVITIAVGQDSSLYLVTDLGIKKYDYKLNSFKSFHPKNLTTYFSITCIKEDRNKILWFGTYHGGLYRFNQASGEMKIYDIRDGLASNWITTIEEDSEGNLWLGSWGNGITRIGKDGQLRIFNNKNGIQDEKYGEFLRTQKAIFLLAQMNTD